MLSTDDFTGFGTAWFDYDTDGQLTTITDAVGRQTILTYDGNGHVTQASDPFGRTATFEYDGLGAETLIYGSPSGLGQGGTGTLKVDGKIVATKKIEKTIPMPFILPADPM